MFTKHASVERADVLALKGSKNRIYTASLDKVADYNDFKIDDDFLYVRIRAISSRVNQNYDGWPTLELAGSQDLIGQRHSADGFTIEASQGDPEFGFATFMHKPIFVDHNNGDPKKTRGMIVDAKFRVLDSKTAALDPYWSSKDVDPLHLPGSEIELLLEIDARNYPKFAKAVKLGHIDGFSMGCNVRESTCSHCGNVATSADQFCSHVKLKGIEHEIKTSSGERIRKKSYENVSGVQFFEISGVFNPADETALTREIIAGLEKESEFYNEFGEQAPDPLRGQTGEYLDGPLIQKGQLPQGDLAKDEGYEQIPYQVVPGGADPNQTRDDGGNLGINPTMIPGQDDISMHGLPKRNPSPIRPQMPSQIYNQDIHGRPEALPNQPVQNDPRWSATHLAENPLPQEMHTRAPDPIDTLRDEKICPECGSDMLKETCEVCFPPGTLVRTAQGLQPIETIEVGDWVLGADGELNKVAEVMVRDYHGTLKKINTPSLLEPILATPNHPFAVLVGDHSPQKTEPCKQSRCTRHSDWKSKHSFAWQHAGCLTTDHYVVSNHLDNTIVDIDTISIPEKYRGRKRLGAQVTNDKYRQKAIDLIEKHGEYVRNGSMEFETNEDFLWMVGQYLAEGSSGTRSVNFASHRKETEYQQRLINYFESQGYSTKLVHREDKPNSAWVDVYSSSLAEWFPNWLGHGCEDKHIPATLINLPIEKLEHIYAGYLSGDGADEWNSAKTTSPVLALQVSEIGRRLGARPSIQSEYPKNKRTAYTVNNVNNKVSKRRSTNKNIKNTWMVDNHLLYRITSVEDVEYSGPVYNLRVEGNPTYTIQNLLVHNCGYTEPPDKFNNPDLDKAQTIRNQMKQVEEAAAQPQPQQAPQAQSPQPGQPQPQGQPNNPQTTANINNRMTWTPLVTEKTAARINKVEKPVVSPNTIQTNQPTNNTVVSDQMAPVTSAMLNAQRLMATAQRNHIGESMSNVRVADGATPPDGTSAKDRVDVVGVGGFDQASNEAASKAQKQVDVTGIGGTGVEGVESPSEELPTASPESDDSGFNKDKITESIPTMTYGDKDGEHSGITDPVTSKPFPATEEGVKAAAAYHQAVHQAQIAYHNAQQSHLSYDDKTLEQNEQQGDPVAKGGTAVKGVPPIDPVATESYERVNVLEHKTTPSNNSGPTKTWTGTDGNGVNKQQDPVTKTKQETGGVPTPDVKLHTGGIRIAAIRLADLEYELGVNDDPSREEYYNRLAAINELPDYEIQAQIASYTKVKTAGLAKLAQARTSGVTRLPKMFGKASAAPGGFERIANDLQAPQPTPISDDTLDSQLFFK